MFNTLTIRSIDNEDWNGTFIKGQVEEGLTYLGFDFSENDWMEYILTDMFSSKELDAHTISLICMNDRITKIHLNLAYGEVTIEKR